MKTTPQSFQYTFRQGRSWWSCFRPRLACAALAAAGLVSAARCQTIFSDGFTNSGTITPWTAPYGSWTETGGQMVGGPDSLSSYGFVYVTNSASNYTVQAQIQFSTTSAFGGGLGGYVNTATGAHYAAWIYPDASTGGSDVLKLIKFQTWTTFGYQGTNFAVMAIANLGSVGTTNHTLKLGFQGTQITVSYDGTQVISTNDVEAQPYTNGAISLDFYTDSPAYNFYVDNVAMVAQSSLPVANNDSYNAVSGRQLTVAAPGVLANDTGGNGPLSAVLVTSPSHDSSFSFSTNGGFTYTAATNFTGMDTFTYKATDGHTNSAAATVTITVSADQPPVANNDSYTMLVNNALTVAAPGVLANDTDAGGFTLTALLASGPTNGTLSLNTNGGFTYTPATNFSGTDSFTYNANDGLLNSTTPATVSINVLPATTLFLDTFTNGTVSPWVVESGNWAVSGGQLVGGVDANQIYGYVYLTNVWTNYSVQAQIQFSTTNGYGGGVGGRLNASTGAHYGAWVYPEGSMGGSNVLKLIKFQTWTTFGYNGTNFVPMQVVNLPGVGTGVHTLKMAFLGSQIAVYYDGSLVLSTTDTDTGGSPYLTGGVSADNWTDTVGYDLNYSNFIISALANNDSYAVNENTPLTVSAPGVLANDTDGFGTNLTAAQVTGPSNGLLALSTNGGFTYTPNNGFVGQDSFTYQATDGGSNLGTATVYLNVSFQGAGTVFAQNFDSSIAPALPSGWTTSSSGAESNWTTTTATNNTPPNAVFVPDPPSIGLSSLTSPVIALPTGAAQLSFRNNYNLEIGVGTDGFDGGILEIKIGTNAFTDIIAAGGTFVSGGYNAVIDTGFSSPLAGQPAWSGDSGGFINTTVNLPDSASGQNIQLMWVCGTDSGNGPGNWTGWYIDTIAISNCATFSCWNTAPVLPSQPNRTNNELVQLIVTNTATDEDIPAQTLTYSLSSPPTGAVISTNGIITWTPAQNESPSTNTITTVVTDNGTPPYSATNKFTVVVKEVNVAPSLANISNRISPGLATVTVTNTATNANIHATNSGYVLTSAPSGASISGSGIISWTPNAGQVPSTNLFTTVVTNSDPFDLVNPHLTATNSFTVTVTTVHNGPSLNSQPNRTNNELVQLTVTNTAIDTDVPVLTLTYSVVAPTPSGVAISTNGIITWTPAQTQSPSTNTIVTVVTDNGSPNLSATNSFTVVVKEVNVPPSLPAQSNLTVNELTTLTVTNTATNANIHATILGYGLVNSPTNASISTNGIITWTPAQTQSPSTNTIMTVVTNRDTFDTVNTQLTATNSFTVVVKEVNVAPSLATISNRVSVGLATVTVTNTATNANIHATNSGYVLTSAPGGAVISSNGVISWTPNVSQVPSTNLFTTVVTNTDSFDLINPHLTATNSFTVTVNAIHNGPSLPSQNGQTVNEQALLTVTNTAIDTDIPALTLTYSVVAPTPTGVNISTNGIITWTPTQSQSASTNTIVTVVTDNGTPNLSATNSFTVVVKELNTPPVLPVQSNLTVNELTLLTVTNTATNGDIHATILGYGLVNSPTNASIDTNGIITWTPAQTQSPGSYTITTVVTNSNPLDTVNPELTATNSFMVTVQEVNVAPSLPTLSNVVSTALATVTVTNTATNGNIHATILGYGLLGAPGGAVISSNGIISWTPNASQVPSTNLFTTVVTNSDPFDLVNPHLTATNSFTVTVNAIHNGPSLPSQNGQTVNEQALLTVTNTAIDTDIPALTLTYSVVAPTPTGVNISTNGIITWTPTQSQSASTNTIVTVVTDNGTPNLSATNSFTVVVKELNTPPVLPVQSNLTVNELTLLTVTNTATNGDIHATILGYGLVNSPTNASIDTNGIITWTPAQTQSPGSYTITTVVTNSNPLDTVNPELTATNSFMVTVQEVNAAPVLPVQSNLTVNELTPITVTNTANNGNIHATILGYGLVNSPTNASIDTNGIITWTPAQTQSPGSYTITTVVTNSDVLDTVNPELTATNSFMVTVQEVNVAPSLPTLSNVVSTALAPVTVTNTATNGNIHATILGYGLLGAPGGAVISSNGIITWTPNVSQVPSTNLFTTVVTNSDPLDTVNPQLTATNSFTVTVNAIHNGPSLPSQNNQTITEPATLTVTNTATDTDIPALTLTYSVVAPTPTGVNISTNGIITWTPNGGQAPSTNTIVTVVSDSGMPSLSATNSFTVIVIPNAPAPTIQSITYTNGSVVLTWSSVSGRSYHRQYKNDIGATNWTDISPDVLANGSVTSATNSTGNAAIRFYRVGLMP